MGLDKNMQLVMSGVLNVTQLVGVTTSLWTMDSLGRRALLLTGSILMAISHIVIAILVGLFGKNWPAHRAEGWTSVAFLLFYMLAFGCSWGPLAWALPSGMLNLRQGTCGLLLSNKPCRDLPLFPPCKRCGPLDLFELAE